MILIPGVVETTSNFVEHPEVVARRIEEAVAAVGDRERVIASSDCGFGTLRGANGSSSRWCGSSSRRSGKAPTSLLRGCGARRPREQLYRHPELAAKRPSKSAEVPGPSSFEARFARTSG